MRSRRNSVYLNNMTGTSKNDIVPAVTMCFSRHVWFLTLMIMVMLVSVHGLSPHHKSSQTTEDTVPNIDDHRRTEKSQKTGGKSPLGSSHKIDLTYINNKAKGGIVLFPKLFNIYYGMSSNANANTLKQAVVDNLASKIGYSDYGDILQTYTDSLNRTAAPIVFVGSYMDASVSPGRLASDPILDASFIQGLLDGYYARRSSNKIPFSDTTNTIYTILMGPGWQYLSSVNYCGFHQPYYLTVQPTIRVFVSLVLHGDVNGCNLFGMNR